MPQIKASIIVETPQQAVYELAQDYDRRLDWDPFTRSMQFLRGATAPAPGIRVRGRSWHGLSMEVVYISVKPPEQAAMRMTKGPFFFSVFAGSWRFEPLKERRTRLTFKYTFKTRWHRLRWLLDPVIRFVFQRDVHARLLALKRHAESDQLRMRSVKG